MEHEDISELNQRRRAWFHRHFQDGVAFNAAIGVVIPRWDPDGVEFRLSFRPDLGAHEGVFHGGVLAALIDTTACGAVLAGHDFAYGSRVSTIDLTVQYLRPAIGGVVAYSQCTKRGRSVNFADVMVRTVDGKDVAHGIVTVMIAGERAGLD